MLLNSFGLDASNNQLTTEVKILGSPSVLMPTFEFVKNEKLKKGNESYKNKIFRGWRNNFSANLEKNSSVLNVRYKDKDKDLIIPVLEKFQKLSNYSNKNRLRNIELASRYFEDQIMFYTNKSRISTKKPLNMDLSILYLLP